MNLNYKSRIFDLKSKDDFDDLALDIFHFQRVYNPVYKNYVDQLKITPAEVDVLHKIPFLPVEFFKNQKVISGDAPAQITFESSGTTGSNTSKHLVADVSFYEESFVRAFNHFYGELKNWRILALLPSYLERSNSSLVYMMDYLIRKSGHKQSAFYLKDLGSLKKTIEELEQKKQATWLIGTPSALIDLAEKHPLKLKSTTVVETGGMKGLRRELVREELHSILCTAFGIKVIHSEYGMTELLSQAYSQGNGIFKCPPWMKVMVRDTNDPFTFLPPGQTGGLNIIDLANINSCSFIATQDLGKLHSNNSFEMLGRFDNSDIRGCNLLVG